MRTLDVSHLPPYDISSQSPLWWGQLCIDIAEGMMLCILMAAYLYMRLRMDVWPPPGDQYPHLLLPTLSLIALILSAILGTTRSDAEGIPDGSTFGITEVTATDTPDSDAETNMKLKISVKARPNAPRGFAAISVELDLLPPFRQSRITAKQIQD